MAVGAATVASARERGLTALERLQQDGVFPLGLWPERPAATPADSLFCTAATLLACGELLPRRRVEAALEVIERRRRPDGHWAWLPDDSLAPDADSTAAALAALIRFGNEPPASTTILRSYWRAEAERFRTWLHGPLGTPERDDAVVTGVLTFVLLAGREPTFRILDVLPLLELPLLAVSLCVPPCSSPALALLLAPSLVAQVRRLRDGSLEERAWSPRADPSTAYELVLPAALVGLLVVHASALYSCLIALEVACKWRLVRTLLAQATLGTQRLVESTRR